MSPTELAFEVLVAHDLAALLGRDRTRIYALLRSGDHRARRRPWPGGSPTRASPALAAVHPDLPDAVLRSTGWQQWSPGAADRLA